MARAVRFRCTPESVEAHMTRLLLTVTFTAMLASLAEAQPVSDPRIADLVRAGKIRVGMHSIMYTEDAQTGALKAASTGIILLDLARTLAARMDRLASRGARLRASVIPAGSVSLGAGG